MNNSHVNTHEVARRNRATSFEGFKSMKIKTTRFFISALLFASLLTLSCSDGDDEPAKTDQKFERSQMLQTYASQFILPAYQRLNEATGQLVTDISQFAENPSQQSLTSAQNSLKSARLAWQYASLFEFGPAEQNLLRATLNTFPTDTARIESNIASGSFVLGSIENRAAAGFAALGYLLHRPDSSDSILAAFTGEGNRANRIAYVQANAELIETTVGNVLNGWNTFSETFLSEARAGTDIGSSLGQMLNAFILHFERFVRDGKIGIPSGVRSAGVPRPLVTEALYAGYSAELATESMKAVRDFFTADRSFSGGSDDGTFVGLEENLIALDRQDLATDIITQMDEAVVALEALSDPLSQAIQTNNDPTLSAFSAMQDVVVLMKADMASALGISITFQDNDGD